MQVWKITGQAGSDRDNGGLTVVYAVTWDAADFPDVDRALATADPSSMWYSIEHVERVGELPMAWVDGEQGVRNNDHLIPMLKAIRDKGGKGKRP